MKLTNWKNNFELLIETRFHVIDYNDAFTCCIILSVHVCCFLCLSHAHIWLSISISFTQDLIYSDVINTSDSRVSAMQIESLAMKFQKRERYTNMFLRVEIYLIIEENKTNHDYKLVYVWCTDQMKPFVLSCSCLFLLSMHIVYYQVQSI